MRVYIIVIIIIIIIIIIKNLSIIMSHHSRWRNSRRMLLSNENVRARHGDTNVDAEVRLTILVVLSLARSLRSARLRRRRRSLCWKVSHSRVYSNYRPLPLAVCARCTPSIAQSSGPPPRRRRCCRRPTASSKRVAAVQVTRSQCRRGSSGASLYSTARRAERARCARRRVRSTGTNALRCAAFLRARRRLGETQPRTH